jgi:hypothetical protein
LDAVGLKGAGCVLDAAGPEGPVTVGKLPDDQRRSVAGPNGLTPVPWVFDAGKNDDWPPGLGGDFPPTVRVRPHRPSPTVQPAPGGGGQQASPIDTGDVTTLMQAQGTSWRHPTPLYEPGFGGDDL